MCVRVYVCVYARVYLFFSPFFAPRVVDLTMAGVLSRSLSFSRPSLSSLVQAIQRASLAATAVKVQGAAMGK